jgi:hypothetical protein
MTWFAWALLAAVAAAATATAGSVIIWYWSAPA